MAHKSLALETHDNSLLRITNFALDKIRSFEVSKGCYYQATEQEVQGILSNEVQSLRESAASYREAADSAQDDESRRKFETLYFERLSEAGLLAMYLSHRASESEMSVAEQHATHQNLSDRVFDDGRLVEMVERGY